MRIRLITYNIHKGIGGIDRRYRPERIVQTMQHFGPDIVFLQEGDDGVPRSRGHRQVDYLGEALQFPHRLFQKNVSLRQGHYGNAILSRFPLSKSDDIELTLPLKKRRRALAAQCRIHGSQLRRTLILVNMHLGLADYERSIQLKRLLRAPPIQHRKATTAIIMGGDLNDVWGNLGRRWLQPAGFQTAAGPVNTFPAFRPLRPLDRFFFRGNVNCNHCFSGQIRAARFASDHLPLIADFEVE